MDEEDAIKLLMNLSKTEETKENEILAAQIVQVYFPASTYMIHLINILLGPPLFRSGCISCWGLHSTVFIVKGLLGTVSP